jgi:hypothetical protein
MSNRLTIIPSPVKQIDQGPTKQQYNTPIFNFYQQNFGDYNIAAHKFIEPKKQIDQGPTKQQTYIFSPFPSNQERATDNYFISPIKRFEGPTTQQTYLFPPYPFELVGFQNAANYTLIQPSIRVEGPTVQQTYIFKPFPSPPIQLDSPQVKLASPVIHANVVPQTYIFPIFNFDYLKLSSAPFIPVSQSFLLATFSTSTVFWCADTGMSGMTGGGSINDLGGY